MTRLFITQFLKSDLNYTNPQGQQPRMKNPGWAPGMLCIFYRITQEVLNLVLPRKNRIFTAIRNGGLSYKMHNIFFPTYAHAKQHGILKFRGISAFCRDMLMNARQSIRHAVPSSYRIVSVRRENIGIVSLAVCEEVPLKRCAE